MNDLIENPGYLYIIHEICMYLDQKSLLSCRISCKSWKNIVDDPILWIKKCNQKSQFKAICNLWINLIETTRGTSIELKVTHSLIKMYRSVVLNPQKVYKNSCFLTLNYRFF